jgi:hypothetical protein
MVVELAELGAIRDTMAGQSVLILLGEERVYQKRKRDIVSSLGGVDRKICYVCLSKPYEDVYSDLRKLGAKGGMFYFIDVLSSHYGKKRATINCTFIDSPSNLGGIRSAISAAICEKGCSVVLFDTISKMLAYHESLNILRFTNDFLSDWKKCSRTFFLALREEIIPLEGNDQLIKDLSMFADRTVEFANGRE